MSRRNNACASVPAIEPIDSRCLLDAGPAVIGDLIGADARSLMYYDTDGTQVTVRLRNGLATVNWVDPNAQWTLAGGVAVVGSQAAPAEIDVIELFQTTIKSELTIRTKVPRSSDADSLATVRGIRGADELTAMGKIIAPKVVLSGYDDAGQNVAIDIGGGVRSVSIHSCAAALLELGGTVASTLSFQAAGSVESPALIFAGTVTRLAAGTWTGQTIQAGAFGRIVISGCRVDGAFVSGLSAALEATVGSIGSITVTGGDLAGEVTAHGKVGSIKLTGKAITTNGDEGKTTEMFSADLTAPITAGELEGVSIGKIQIVGGAMGPSGPLVIRTAGSVGPMSSRGMNYRTYEQDEEGHSRAHTAYCESGMNLDLLADTGDIGSITVTGGSFAGTIEGEGTVAGVTTKAVRGGWGSDATYVGGTMDATITAARVKKLAATGGDLTASLTAPLIGTIHCNALKRNARLLRTVEEGEVSYDVTEGEVFGGNINLTLQMLGEAAELGAVTAFGGSLTAEGQVSFDPATARLVSKPMRYICSYEDAGDEDHPRMAAVYETVGGPDAVTNNLTQA